MAGKVPIGRRQGWQLQLTVAGRFERQRFRQRFAQGQERVGELGNVQRQLALPYGEVDAIVQRFAEYRGRIAQQLARLWADDLLRQHQATCSCQGPNGSGRRSQPLTPTAHSLSFSRQTSSSRRSWSKLMFCPMKTSP